MTDGNSNASTATFPLTAGNSTADRECDTCTRYDSAARMALLSTETLKDYLKDCNQTGLFVTQGWLESTAESLGVSVGAFTGILAGVCTLFAGAAVFGCYRVRRKPTESRSKRR